MASALDNLFTAASTTAGQLFTAAGNAVAEVVNETAEDIEDIGEAAENEGLAAAMFETVDAGSLGNFVANGAGALGLIPDGDEVTKNIVSGVVNFASGGFLNPAVWTDAADLLAEAGKAQPKPGVRAPRSHQPTRPNPCAGQPGGYCGTEAPRGPRSVLDGLDGLTKAVTDHLAELVAGGGLAPIGGPICCPAPPSYRIPVPPEVIDAIDRRPRPTDGGPVMGRPIAEVSYDDIFNDKSLSFEDLLFLVMMKVGHDMQKEIEAQLKELADVNKQLDGNGSTKKTGAPANASATQGPPGSDLGGMVQGFLSPGNLEGMACGALDLASALAPIVVPAALTALGTVVPGLGNAVGLIGGEAIGLLTTGACQLLKAGVQSGAFDGLFESAGQLAGQASGGGVAGGGAAQGAPASNGPASEDDKTALRARREELFEKIKLANSKLSEMQQTLSNIMNAQHETAMAAIRNIR